VELVKWIRLQWDRVLGAAAAIVGVLMLVAGWIEVSSTEFVAEQIPFVISAGLGGIVAVLIGGTLWLSADLRDEWRALDRIAEQLTVGDEVLDDLTLRLQAMEAGAVESSSRRNGTRRGRRPLVSEP
jgi:type VI protein secretion system component VasK